MNGETKRHIDAARQVLVGVVPNPTSQIDQITNALIYKFMDDMDQAAIKAGGEPSFFVGDLKNYAWTRLMDARIGNQERMNIYGEALVKFSESKQLPQLFRDIFKSAFLPYRSPEVLGLFLKEISYFDYSHPEELGNAYEYLLSIMSSQGDAGQFRTPRHIIDFIVDVVNPTKDDKVLDPACGTGGFLVSAYKQILEQHDGKNDPKKKEKPLTPDQRKNLMNNFEGYDVDPGMVRIAQVNMYLHQFKNPKIVQYDTLSMEERWGDKFDVILANPPFMSPRGGVQVHNKFSIPSNRSEVLFVDYIMNHLRPKGRAGVIVPEGIIFQSANTHKQLRKNLVEDGLYAVVSLPGGVFNPYAGVKTSILFFDNEIAKRQSEIVFVKVEQDGFDLGANKRPINKNDLPEALSILDAWKNGKKVESDKVIYVEKAKITENGDYNLSGDRYRVNVDYANAKWPMVKIKDLCEMGRGRVISKRDIEENPGEYPVYSSQTTDNGCFGYLGSYDFDGEYVTWTTDGANAGTVFYRDGKFNCTNVCGTLKKKADIEIDMKFLAKVLDKVAWKYVIQVGNPKLMNNVMGDIEIPLPPADVQNKIVEEIEIKQNAIDAAKKVIKNLEREREYFGQAFRRLEGVKMVKLSEVCEINRKSAEPIKLFGKSEFVYVDISSVENGTGFVSFENKVLSENAPSRARRVIKDDDVLLSTVRPNLKAFAYLRNLPDKVLASTGFAVLTAKEKVLSKYIFHLLFTDELQNQMIAKMGRGSYPSINQDDVEQFLIPLQSLEIQEKLVTEAEKEQEIINANKKLIGIMKQKEEAVLTKLWK